METPLFIQRSEPYKNYVSLKKRMLREEKRLHRIKTKWIKFRQATIEMKNKFYSLGLTLNEIVYRKPFPKKPFDRESSYEFLYAVKQGKLRKVQEYLQNDKYLVYQYDNVNAIFSLFNNYISFKKPPFIGHASTATSKWYNFLSSINPILK